MSIYFLGFIKSMRSYYWLSFYVFFRVIKPIWKSSQQSILHFLSSFIKMKEQKKSGGFMHKYISCSSPSSHLQTWHPFRISVKWVGYPLPPGHDYSHWVYTSPNGYSSSHPWRLVSVSSSQCCRVILSDIPISLKIVCLETYLLSSPSY